MIKKVEGLLQLEAKQGNLGLKSSYSSSQKTDLVSELDQNQLWNICESGLASITSFSGEQRKEGRLSCFVDLCDEEEQEEHFEAPLEMNFIKRSPQIIVSPTPEAEKTSNGDFY